MAEQQPQMTEAEASEWVRLQFQRANKFLAEKGILTDRVLTKDSRYLVPHVAVWKFSTQDQVDVWVVNGDVPSDVVGAGAAKTAREALRHFSLQWQIQADKILTDEKLSQDPEQQKYAKYLIQSAENLYQTTQVEDLWEDQPQG
ncbi:DUF4826 family protein [Pseudidiomarina sp.]|uniref:DUF4826 family protein n=1 Tax=Pseudidiomarina sp. TaxID=2081707 RepID=UPI00299F4580|nr:DUF4826 family protein [Pseudidiomarina sp.]MDX1704976.1 DUF4826 family protein [Pseudidiomarina sp.]